MNGISIFDRWTAHFLEKKSVNPNQPIIATLFYLPRAIPPPDLRLSFETAFHEPASRSFSPGDASADLFPEKHRRTNCACRNPPLPSCESGPAIFLGQKWKGPEGAAFKTAPVIKGANKFERGVIGVYHRRNGWLSFGCEGERSCLIKMPPSVDDNGRHCWAGFVCEFLIGDHAVIKWYYHCNTFCGLLDDWALFKWT